MSKNKNKQSTQLPVLPQREKLNSLTEFALGIQTQQNQISQSDTVDANLRRYMISQNRMLLSYLYVEIGICQTLIDQPVDDALNKIPEIVSEQLKPKDVEIVRQYIQEHNWFETFKQAEKWKRLYGGSGLFINTPQNPLSELRIDRLNKDTPIELYALDRWELCYQVSGEVSVNNLNVGDALTDTPYNIYGQQVHKTRVLQFKGKEAPSILKLQLQGWGMSEVERLLRSLNSFLKNQDVIFELLDEAKVDVFKINGFTEALMTAEGTNNITKQVQLVNQLKSYLNALVMDKEDEFDQKHMTFAGLSDMHEQNRMAIAADLKMPITKLWGVSAAGFNSGEDDIENYNSMLESEIRVKSRQNLIMLIKIACQVTLGFIPEDIDLVYPPLRILSAEQEELVKEKQFARVLQSYTAGLLSEEQYIDACNKANLLPIEVKVDKKGILARIKDKMAAGKQQAPIKNKR